MPLRLVPIYVKLFRVVVGLPSNDFSSPFSSLVFRRFLLLASSNGCPIIIDIMVVRMSLLLPCRLFRTLKMLRFFSFVKFILVVGFLVIAASFLLLIAGHQNLFNQQEISPKLSEFNK